MTAASPVAPRSWGADVATAVGLLLLFAPVIVFLAFIPEDIVRVVTSRPPASIDLSWSQVWIRFAISVAAPLAGYALLVGARREDALPRWSWGDGRSWWAGFRLFPIVFLATIALAILVLVIQLIRDPKTDLTPTAILGPPGALLSAALVAGVGEELAFRGVLQGALLRVVSAPVAIVTQAVLFGAAHAGWGSWEKLVIASAFGAMVGVVALRHGLLAAMSIHALNDAIAFGATLLQGDPAVAGSLFLALLIGLGVWAGFEVRRWWLHRQRPDLSLAPPDPGAPPPW